MWVIKGHENAENPVIKAIRVMISNIYIICIKMNMCNRTYVDGSNSGCSALNDPQCDS